MSPPPKGIKLVAGAFLLAAGYLSVLGLTMLLSPGVLSMALGAPLLNGLETSGAYMFLLMGGIGAVLGLGLLRRHNYARRIAIIVALLGIVMLAPGVSGAVIEFHASKLATDGLGIIVRAAIVWYLYQPSVAESFSKRH